MWNELSTGIGNLLATVSDLNSDTIFNYRKSSFDKYPAVVYFPADGDGEFADTQRTQRTYVFQINVYQERVEKGASDTESIMRQRVDDLITLFDTNKYLDNDRLQGRGFVRPIPSRWDLVQGEQVDVLRAQILLMAVVIQ